MQKALYGVEGEGYCGSSLFVKVFQERAAKYKAFLFFSSEIPQRPLSLLCFVFVLVRVHDPNNASLVYKLFASSPGINEFTSTIVGTQHSCSVSVAEVKLSKLYGYQTINEKKEICMMNRCMSNQTSPSGTLRLNLRFNVFCT